MKQKSKQTFCWASAEIVGWRGLFKLDDGFGQPACNKRLLSVTPLLNINISIQNELAKIDVTSSGMVMPTNLMQLKLGILCVKI